MKPLLNLLLVIAIASGCVSAPPNNSGFSKLDTIYELQGSYKNKGERDNNGSPYPIYLSFVIWPNETTLKHEELETIEVVVVSKNSISVKALSKRGVEKEETFIEGKHFDITDGRISLKRGFRIVGTKSGEPRVGPGYERVELGIDKKSQGKLRSDGAVVGLVYMFFPFAFAVREDVRFIRIEP